MRSVTVRHAFVFISTCLLLAQTRCGPTASTDGGTGTLRVLITDKPYPVELLARADVTITRVLVRRAGDIDSNGVDADTNGGDLDTNGAGESPFIEVFAGEQVFDLLHLRNGQTDLLGLAAIPAGAYTQVRVFVTAGEVELIDGRVFPLTVPSGAASGIKLNFDFEVAAEEETTLLLDVDLSRIFTPIPGGAIDRVEDISSFHFSPSLAMRLIALVDAGSITGIVTDEGDAALANVLVTAFYGDEEVTSTASDDAGTFTLIGLPAGDYRLEISAIGHTDAQLDQVAVTAGETTEVGNVVLGAAGE